LPPKSPPEGTTSWFSALIRAGKKEESKPPRLPGKPGSTGIHTKKIGFISYQRKEKPPYRVHRGRRERRSGVG